MTKQYQGILEIDEDRGVIYFHLSNGKIIEKLGVVTILRICRLPKPIPNDRMLDITHMIGCNWK